MCRNRRDAAEQLAKFVRGLGGSLAGSELPLFYKKHPEAQTLVGKKVRDLCTDHSDLLRFVANSGCGTIQATAGGKSRSGRKAATALADYVASKGGHMDAGHIGEFYKQNPGMKEAVGELRTFCATHSDLLCMRVRGSAATISKKQAERARSSTPAPRETNSTTKEEREKKEADKHGLEDTEHRAFRGRGIAHSLVDFVEARGGNIDAGVVGIFYLENPGLKEAIGDLRAFCGAHSDLLSMTLKGSAATISAVRRFGPTACQQEGPAATASACTESGSKHDAAVLLAKFVKRLGGRMPGSQISEFYKEHPEAKRLIGGKTKDLCDDHGDLLRFQANGGCGFLIATQSAGSNSAAAALSTPAKAPAVSAEEYAKVALLWKHHLDDRPHLIGAARAPMAAEFKSFCTELGLSPKLGFGLLMSTLQKMGFEKHGTWAPENDPGTDASCRPVQQQQETTQSTSDLHAPPPTRCTRSGTSAPDPWLRGDPWQQQPRGHAAVCAQRRAQSCGPPLSAADDQNKEKKSTDMIKQSGSDVRPSEPRTWASKADPWQQPSSIDAKVSTPRRVQSAAVWLEHEDKEAKRGARASAVTGVFEDKNNSKLTMQSKTGLCDLQRSGRHRDSTSVADSCRIGDPWASPPAKASVGGSSRQRISTPAKGRDVGLASHDNNNDAEQGARASAAIRALQDFTVETKCGLEDIVHRHCQAMERFSNELDRDLHSATASLRTPERNLVLRQGQEALREVRIAAAHFAMETCLEESRASLKKRLDEIARSGADSST